MDSVAVLGKELVGGRKTEMDLVAVSHVELVGGQKTKVEPVAVSYAEPVGGPYQEAVGSRWDSTKNVVDRKEGMLKGKNKGL